MYILLKPVYFFFTETRSAFTTVSLSPMPKTQPKTAGPSKKKKPPPGCGKNDPPNYTFDKATAIKHTTSAHKTTFSCKILGTPRPQYRSYPVVPGQHRAAGNTVRLGSWSKPNQKSFASAFQEAMQMAKVATVFDVSEQSKSKPVLVTVRFYFPLPKCHYTFDFQTRKWNINRNVPMYVTRTPDLDNLVKLVLDALQKVCYENDMSVADINSMKVYDSSRHVYDDNYRGCTLIKITQIHDEMASEPNCKCFCCNNKTK